MVRKIYYGIVIFFALAFSLATCVGIFFDNMCGNDIVQEVLSPDKKLKAVIFTRSCGATTGYSTQVSVLPECQKLPNAKGSILITDWDGKALMWKYGGVPVEVDWVSKDKLIIKYPKEAKTFTRKKNYGEVSIQYAQSFHHN